jgi:membrane protease YdiL (CAAX protease family)
MDRGIPVYITTTFGLAIAISLAVGMTGGHESPLLGLGAMSMFLPAAGVLTARVMKDEGLAIDWKRLPLRHAPAALFLMPAVMHAVMLPATAIVAGGLPWATWLTPQADGLYHSPDSMGWGVLTASGLARRLARNALAGVLVVSALALFEEVGWRGFLLPRLIETMGTRKAIAAVSAIWALWHTPFALSGIHYLAGTSAQTTAFIMPIGQFGAGLTIGWLWARTESIWITSLAHGALNNWGQYAFKFMGDIGPSEAVVLAAGNVALCILGGVLLRRLPARVLETGEREISNAEL